MLDNLCRKCGGKKETMSHALVNCPMMQTLINERHDALEISLVQILSSKFQGTVIRQKTYVNELRPDITMESDTQYYLVEVKCPFDTKMSFELRTQQTTDKYNIIIEILEDVHPGKEVRLVTFIVGTLGSWGPQNSDFLRDLGFSKDEIDQVKTRLMLQNINSSCEQWKRFVQYAPTITPGPIPDAESEDDQGTSDNGPTAATVQGPVIDDEEEELQIYDSGLDESSDDEPDPDDPEMLFTIDIEQYLNSVMTD